MCPGKIVVACALAAFARIAAADTLIVFAAASLKDALDENVKAEERRLNDQSEKGS